MIDLFQVAAGLQSFLLEREWRFCFIGGVALQRWGEPRVTQDVDCTLLTGFGKEPQFVSELLGRYQPRIEDAEAFALRNRVLLVSESGIGIDISLGGLPFEALLVQRASSFRFLPEIELRTCSAEDLIVLKAFADRRRDWADIEGIVVRQRGRLDWRYVYGQLRPLCDLKEDLGIVDTLKALQQDAEK
ncbi:MAG: nucleotidyl transferase AbiEii/AbiGii toxin family protein [Spirochaetales bacterium]|nr:nucleotidyl transferase AbiEii/AbiGii toxin family protein [Spirochaetales bacterium]